MIAKGTPLVWPLLNKMNPTVAFQQRPKSSANQGLTAIPVIPWNDFDRPGTVGYGIVEGNPKLWDFSPWQFGLAATGVSYKRLQDLKTSPRVHRLSDLAKFPAVVHPIGLWQVFPPSPSPRDDRQANRINWLLMKKLFFDPNRIVRGDPKNQDLRSMVGGNVKIQQKPKAILQKATPFLPWAGLNPSTAPAVVHQLKPYPPTRWIISGVTKDETGTPAGGFTVYLFNMKTGSPVLEQTTVSDGSGNYSFSVGQSSYWAVDYKVGSPDKAGATRKDLSGVSA